VTASFTSGVTAPAPGRRRTWPLADKAVIKPPSSHARASSNAGPDWRLVRHLLLATRETRPIVDRLVVVTGCQKVPLSVDRVYAHAGA
jgi:hypothetical protein